MSLELFDVQPEVDTSLSVGAPDVGAKNARVLILGLGNVLLKDEGVGVHAAEALQGLDLPTNVEVLDGGTAGLDILLSQQGLHKLVVVDAVKAGQEAGTIYQTRIKAHDKGMLTRIFGQQELLRLSLHQANLLDALNAANKMNCLPRDIVIIGVEPNEINYGLELTAQVERRIPEIINLVLREIKDAVH